MIYAINREMVETIKDQLVECANISLEIIKEVHGVIPDRSSPTGYLQKKIGEVLRGQAIEPVGDLGLYQCRKELVTDIPVHGKPDVELSITDLGGFRLKYSYSDGECLLKDRAVKLSYVIDDSLEGKFEAREVEEKPAELIELMVSSLIFRRFGDISYEIDPLPKILEVDYCG
jgi:hypothetical protein